VSKGVIHRNQAANRKSAMAKQAATPDGSPTSSGLGDGEHGTFDGVDGIPTTP
jgi:hypothetical protein